MWPSHWELLIIFVVVLLLFGAKRIPEMARGLGKGIREFRTAVKDVQSEVDLSGQTDNSAGQQTIPPATPPPGQVAHNAPAQPAAQQAAAESTTTGPASGSAAAGQSTQG